MDIMNAPDSSRPVACNLAAFDDEQRKRYQALRAEMKAALIRSEAVPDGYRFYYPGTAAWVLRLAEFITLERVCCPFFTFTLVAAPDETEQLLTITGNEQAKAVLAAELVA